MKLCYNTKKLQHDMPELDADYLHANDMPKLYQVIGFILTPWDRLCYVSGLGTLLLERNPQCGVLMKVFSAIDTDDSLWASRIYDEPEQYCRVHR